MKTVLILVLSHDKAPYDKMVDTALQTWDSVDVEGTQTIFYFDGTRQNKDKFIYVNVDSGILSMGRKTLAALEYVLNNYQFDYIARVHSSIYVNKSTLIEYVQALPDKDVFAGAEATSANGFQYVWGGVGFIISKDVVQKIVDNKLHWQHKFMEDESMSRVVNWLSIPFSPGYAAGIDNMGDHWRCISYNGESITFNDFSDLKRLKHHFYRVKQDGKRWVDEFIMKELFRVL
jgi:hypothetical protein